MPTPHPHQTTLAPAAVVRVQRVTLDRAGRNVLRDVSLTLAPRARLGVVGPNGVGKSTLLRVLAGHLTPDSGRVVVEPPGATVGLLAQEHEVVAGERVRDALARRTGVLDAESALREAGAALAQGGANAERSYVAALARFDSLGATTFDARAASVLRDLGVADVVDNEVSSLSGGQEAKVALAALELSRFDVALLDEPTNDLDFEGLARLESWVLQRPGATVLVSHDRAFLERVVSDVVELDEHDHSATYFSGGWAGYLSERAAARRLAREAYDEYRRRRSQLHHDAQRHRQWAVDGVRGEIKNPRDHDKAQRDFRINRTEQRAHKARQSERAIERLTPVEKPFEGWNLRLHIEEAPRAGAVVARLERAVVDLGTFRLGPLDVDIAWGERVALTGPNGAGKTTLLRALLGESALTSGTRWFGPSVVVGYLGQDRRSLGGGALERYVVERCSLTVTEARRLLAKFGLRAAHVSRPSDELSPGERTRAELAIFQGRGVNLLVLDEPTNHLDIEAIEQVEAALASYDGTLVLTTHDRRLLDAVAVTRSVSMRDGLIDSDESSH